MDGIREKIGKPLMEGVGTFLFLLTIQVTVGAGSQSAPFAIGLSLMALVYAGGPISGAHYNPAVSLALMMRGKQSLGEMIMYWIFQIVGGWLGALVGGILGGSFVTFSGEAETIHAFLAEFLFAFMLCFVVLSVATHSAAKDNSYYGAAIGLTVTVGALTVGEHSGGAFNPAVALGLCIASGFSNLMYCIMVALADLLGGAAAAWIYYMVAADQFSDATVGETTPLV